MKLSFILAVATSSIAPAIVSAETRLTLLHINDHHSHLSEESAGYVNIYGDDIPSSVSLNNGNTSYVRAYYGGYPRLVTAFSELERDAVEAGRDVLKLHAGDAITGTIFFSIFKGDADARMMSHICFDAFSPGNHEFNEGDAGLAKFLKALDSESNTNEKCQKTPKVLGANIVPHSASALLNPDVPPIDGHAIFTTSDGEEIGVIGINIVQKTMESSRPDEGTILLDEIETTRAQVEILTAQGVNKIIVLTHIGYDKDQELIASLEGVDVVIGGDSHSLLGNNQIAEIASPRGPYATVIERDDGSKVCVVQAWEYSKVLGNLDVDFDDTGNVISCLGTPVFPFNGDTVSVHDADPIYEMSPEDAAVVISSLAERTGGQVKVFSEDPDAVADLESYSKAVEEQTNEVIAVASGTIGLAWNVKDSGVCDFVAQAFLLQPLSTAEIAIQNRGSCRADIEEGNFTINDAYSVLPFSSTLMDIEMTGEQIKNVLEDALDYYLQASQFWGSYPRASGLRFDVNESLKKGNRVSNLEVNPKLANAFWVPLDMSKSYKVVTNDFIATPRDGFDEFGTIDEKLRTNTYLESAQSLIEYAKSVDSLDILPAERASTQNWIGANNPEAEAEKDIGDNQTDAIGDTNDILESKAVCLGTQFYLLSSAIALSAIGI